MSRRVAQTLGVATLIGVEAVLAREYVVRGTTWHLLLHTPLGLGLGLSAGAVCSGWRRHPVPALPWAVGGQVVSVLPDLLFVLARLPHQRWMDVFAGHVTLHLTAAPLGVSTGVFLLGSTAWWTAGWTSRRRLGAGLGLAAVALLLVSLLLAAPLPTLPQLRA